MNCHIYRSSRKDDTYLYVAAKDDFEKVPESLLTMLGPLDYVMELSLSPQTKLAQADVTLVMKQLDEQGYFLQLPPPAFGSSTTSH